MKVLFDHNLPFKLRTDMVGICDLEISTAAWMGWRELKNGELLRAAEEGGFDVFVTGDRTLVLEQNVMGRRLAVVVLSANNWPIIRTRIREILAAIETVVPGSVRIVECGLFSRRTPRD